MKLTREQFEKFIREQRNQIVVDEPYEIVPCRCGDVNCRGWRPVSADRQSA